MKRDPSLSKLDSWVERRTKSRDFAFSRKAHLKGSNVESSMLSGREKYCDTLASASSRFDGLNEFGYDRALVITE